MAYTIKGNPLTFKGGTVIVTPVTVNGLPANTTAYPAMNIVLEKGSLDGDASEAECDTNLFGRLVVAGNAKSSMDLTVYISQANLTAPLTPGANWPLVMGDYLTANLTSGMVNVQGTFMISKQGIPTLDANEKMTLDLSLTAHGNLSVYSIGIVTANGTA